MKKTIQITTSQFKQIIKEGVAKLHKKTLIENRIKQINEELSQMGFSGPEVDVDGVSDYFVNKIKREEEDYLSIKDEVIKTARGDKSVVKNIYSAIGEKLKASGDKNLHSIGQAYDSSMLGKGEISEIIKTTLKEVLGKIVKGISGPILDIDGITDTLVRYYTELPSLNAADEKVYNLSKNTLFSQDATPEIRKEFYLNLSDKIMKLANSIEDELMMGFERGTKNQLITFAKAYNSLANTGLNKSINEGDDSDWTTATMNSNEVDDFIDYLDGWNLQYDAPVDLGNGSVSIRHEKETEDVMNQMNHQDSEERLSNMDDASNYSIEENSEVASPVVMDILNSYLEAALWTEEEEVGHATIEEDISNNSKIDAYKDVKKFMSQAGDLLNDIDPEQVGHDLWLTRNGHGAGFWDRGLGDVGDKLTAIAKGMGSKSVYVGDDGKIYID